MRAPEALEGHRIVGTPRPGHSGADRESCRLAIIVPCYNEGEVLELTIVRLLDTLDEVISLHGCSQESFVVLVDDGSFDDTWELILTASERHRGRIRGVRLARNVGHQPALLCGLEYVTDQCDAAISIDADLQDDPALIPVMIEKYRSGAELVFGIRKSRQSDTWFKRNSALIFYRLIRWIGSDLVENHADFRLMSVNALRNLRGFQERNLFLRGLVPLLHRNIATVTYDRKERLAGETKYPLSKMLSLAWDGITSFSIKPLRLIAAIGVLVFLSSLAMSTYAIIGLVFGRVVPGWTSIVIPLYLLGGLLMISMGVVGEYVGKLFLEVKQRPRFIIESTTGVDLREPIIETR